MAKSNRKGRRKTEPFIQLLKFMLESEAWKKLSPSAVKVFIELQRRFNGRNNGRISLSVSEAADAAGMARNTAHRALKELQSFGFAKCRYRGAYSLKLRHASEWELTDKQITKGKAPSREFMKWEPAKKRKPIANIEIPNSNNENVIPLNDKMVSKTRIGQSV